MAPCTWTDCLDLIEDANRGRTGNLRLDFDRSPNGNYGALYGMVVLPMLQSIKPPRRPKLFEIGFGCGMPGGPGRGMQFWHNLVPAAELWSAEYNVNCVMGWRRDFGRKHPEVKASFKSLFGDQSNATVLAQWVLTSGGNFDVVVDDGSHINSHILKSFHALWPHVNPGGLYVFEDLGPGRTTDHYDDTKGRAVMSDIIQGWTEQMLTIPPLRTREQTRHQLAPHLHAPDDLAFITCVTAGCVLAKSRHAWLAPQRKAIAHALARKQTRGFESAVERSQAIANASAAFNMSSSFSIEVSVQLGLDQPYRPAYRRTR
mmetsp:Transcript_14007/g.30380  ORF Transcript_14007/g.30380 Transcript_14007/m.30380 type:complete len:316 (-) Transcript_14007:345-1292(-)